MALWEDYYQTKWNVENNTFLHILRGTPYKNSKAFLTMISCPCGSIFIFFLLSEATFVVSVAHEDILIMDVLFFWGSPRSYILKTVIYKCEKLEVYK
jgi:ureidoglycolate hydrolase